MASQAQIAANRANARRSTGPKTPAGKAAVALNGVQHGLLSRHSLIQGENRADLVGFGKRLQAQLAPEGELELLLTDRIISTAWRLRRAVAVESALFDGEDKPDNAFGHYGREKMAVLSRYEVTLERSLYKALHELQRFQAARAGQFAPLAEAVHVEVSVSGLGEAEAMALVGKSGGLSGVEINGTAKRIEAAAPAES